MNDIDRLEARITSLETGPYLYMVSASKLDALAARVAALEAKFVTSGATLSDESIGVYMRSLSEKETDAPVVVVSPAPPAPLVERMARSIADKRIELARGECKGEMPDHPHVSWVEEQYARAALLVAAEDLLGPMSVIEVGALPGSTIAEMVNAALRSRLARAKEAARG